jgi:Flp pilus assembly protein TadG
MITNRRSFSSMLRALRNCERGASVLELALVTPALALVVSGMIDLGRAAGKDFFLTNAANHTVELALSKGAVDGTYSYLKDEAAVTAGLDRSKVTVDYWLECNYTRMPSFNDTCGYRSLPFRYVKVTLSDTYRPMFPAWVFSAPIAVTGAAVVRLQ